MPTATRRRILGGNAWRVLELGDRPASGETQSRGSGQGPAVEVQAVNGLGQGTAGQPPVAHRGSD
jgi:hypothetical protein